MNNKITPSFILVLIITILLLIINIILYINNVAIPNSNNKELEEKYNNWLVYNNKTETEIEEITTEDINEQEIEKLKSMSEKSRMQFYFGKYISYIKEEKYDKAYNLLYDEFKQNYFETQEKFEEYVKKTYSKNTSIQYTKLERQGYFYVLFIKLLDPTKHKKDDENIVEQKVVIQENDFNDFKLSFEII